MFLIVPYEVRTLPARVPWANYLLLGLNILCFYLEVKGLLPLDWLRRLILDGKHPEGMIGHQFLHLNLLHLIGNMVFLWVFGNAVAGVMNNGLYLVLYLTLGVMAGCAHLLMSGAPAVGASGAISGLVGFYIAVYPLNRIHCFGWILFKIGFFDLPGFWLVIFWFAFDLFHALNSHGHVAYWAHVGGTVAGFLLGLMSLHARSVDVGDYDNPTMLDYLTGQAAGR